LLDSLLQETRPEGRLPCHDGVREEKEERWARKAAPVGAVPSV